MQNLPHHYSVTASSSTQGFVSLSSSGLETLKSAPPKEFGGPGDKWSPETLLVSAIADCFVLSFRAIARASKLEWEFLDCDVQGVLDKSDGVTQFTSFTVSVSLLIPSETGIERADKLLDKAEKFCLITNSLTAETSLVKKVVQN